MLIFGGVYLQKYTIQLKIGEPQLAYMDVSENSGSFPPKSSTLIGFSIKKKHPTILGYPYFWKHPYIFKHLCLVIYRGYTVDGSEILNNHLEWGKQL